MKTEGMTEKALTVKEGRLLADAWLIVREAQCMDIVMPEYFVAGQINYLFHHDPGFHAVVERIRNFTEAAQREAMDKCAEYLEIHPPHLLAYVDEDASLATILDICAAALRVLITKIELIELIDRGGE